MQKTWIIAAESSRARIFTVSSSSSPLEELETLVHGALIAYPRYVDPVTGLPCPVEVAVDRLSQGDLPSGDPALRLLSKLQGLLASYAYLCR